MRERNTSILFAGLSALPVVAFLVGLPADYPRIGLFAGLGVGVIFGSSVPVEATARARFLRAVRTSLAFAVTTGIGYGVYQGPVVGVSWGLGGCFGSICGVLTAQIARGLFVSEEES